MIGAIPFSLSACGSSDPHARRRPCDSLRKSTHQRSDHGLERSVANCKLGVALQCVVAAIRPGRLDEKLKLSMGSYVIVEHPHSEFSLFAHMKNGSVKVKLGERVSRGEQIAATGMSGDVRSTAAAAICQQSLHHHHALHHHSWHRATPAPAEWPSASNAIRPKPKARVARITYTTAALKSNVSPSSGLCTKLPWI